MWRMSVHWLAAAAAALALPAAPPSPPGLTPGAIYAGASVQPDSASRFPFPATLRLTADARRVDAVSFAERYACPSGDSFTDRVGLADMPIKPDGRFGKVKRFGGTTITVSGQVGPTVASFLVSARDQDDCKALTGFRVLRGADVYGGAGSDDYPATLQLAPSRRSIEQLVVFLVASCTDVQKLPLTYRAPVRLTRIAVAADGAFAAHGTYGYRYGSSGTQVSVVYTVRGRLGRTAAQGALAFTVGGAYRNGAKLFEGCRGTVVWRAESA